jgi:glycerophosphoryl diester phosphodiesterase
LIVLLAGPAAASRDSDRDRMPNWWERQHGLRANARDANRDPDKDGLANLVEFRYRIDPNDPDSDGDAVVDPEELYVYDTDPRREDTDGDLVTDGDEVWTFETSPTRPNNEVTPYVMSVAHRGVSAYAPENTQPSFELASRLGAAYVELDVRETLDEHLVVVHDPQVERTTRTSPAPCKGEVSELTLDELRACDAGTWFNIDHPDLARERYANAPIPTLADVLAQFRDTVHFYVEPKAPGIEEDLLAALESAGVADRTIIESFEREILQRFDQLAPGLPLTQLIGGSSRTYAENQLGPVSAYADRIGVQSAVVDSAFVEHAHSVCLRVDVYTVNDPEAMETMIGHSVDGIITDAPNRLTSLMWRLESEGVPPPQNELSGC